MRPDEISIAVDWAAAEGWNPGLADAACFATVDPQGFLIGEIEGETAATVSCVNYECELRLPRLLYRSRGSARPRLWTADMERGHRARRLHA